MKDRLWNGGGRGFWLSLLLSLAACSPSEPAPKMQGATLLQTEAVALDDPVAAASFGQLAQTGANTVALIPFLRQSSPAAEKLEYSPAVSDAQLLAAVVQAKQAGLRVVLKPQILLEGSWAGEIKPAQAANWFASYRDKILHYAQLAEAQQLEMLVIGTELRELDTRPEWAALIAEIRRIYRGKLTYAAHGIEGATAFAHWDKLDVIGVTLYPALGDSVHRAAMRPAVTQTVQALQALQQRYHQPVLVTEVGIRSLSGAQRTPWDWSVPGCTAPADAKLQADVLDLWLTALSGQPWLAGVLVWNWSSDPYAGGRQDRDYTVQNKPAQSVLECHWRGVCNPQVQRLRQQEGG